MKRSDAVEIGDRPGLGARLKLFLQTRLGVTLMVLFGAGLFLVSFYFPYWNLELKAPQYPDGLHLSVYMDHVAGDVTEVNLLNHYIGMSSLDSAAQLERRFAWHALLLLAIGSLLVIPLGKKNHTVLYLPPIGFLVGFIGDMFFWLYRAGHQLNPDAPVRIKPFTPLILGTGKIGQFVTHAYFGSGFWIFIVATGIVFYGIGRKKPICRNCPDFKTCKILCNRPTSWLGFK